MKFHGLVGFWLVLSSLINTAVAIEVGESVTVPRGTAIKVGYKVLARVRCQTDLEVLSTKGDWLWVAYQGVRGWVHQSNIYTAVSEVSEDEENHPQAHVYYHDFNDGDGPTRMYRTRVYDPETGRWEWTNSNLTPYWLYNGPDGDT